MPDFTDDELKLIVIGNHSRSVWLMHQKARCILKRRGILDAEGSRTDAERGG
ncbi:hypothetical protein [uncultured Paludibaculum sp.]|uniref:hypothetical protein n=1 Tax=uncultured Paludibaculum sp. TaxID=1765020 RepID=UPI002AAB4C05|nr:hypothetical protein [uncultured Paludibaculum sp.]